jgi:hypothetical protein
VSSFVNTCVRALCLAGTVFAWAAAARAQAPGGPSSEGPAPARSGETIASPEPIKLRFDATPEPRPTPAARSGLSPTVFWIAASATIIVASLGGFEALHVRDLYDQAQGIPSVSPQREPLRREMRTAEVTADALLIGSLALAVGTTILAFSIDWSGTDRSNEQQAARAQPRAVADAAQRQPPIAAGRRWW